MNRKWTYVVALVLGPVLLGCGLLNSAVNKAVDSATGGDNFKPAAELWSDVPKMDGLAPSELEDLPLPIKLLMRTILGNLGRLNSAGEDQTTGNIDWISYNSTGTPQDVANFYTADLMTANGWDSSEGAGCTSGDQSGVQGAVFCVFQKKADGKDIQLAIIATQDENTKQTSAFFLRLEEASSASQ